VTGDLHRAAEGLNAVYEAGESGPFAGIGSPDSIVSNRQTKVGTLDVDARAATMKISTPSSQPRYTPLEHIATAERLGYDRARLFATPHEPDVWMMLALAAERTTTISPGPGVLVPSLRHPMVNASTTAALAALAPGRVVDLKVLLAHGIGRTRAT
jgi:hypothetical protein